jgi:hypothetical protein
MQREGIAWRYVLRQRRIPGDDLRPADEVQPGSRQRRHVQRLANMACRVWSIVVLVKDRSARSKIKQRGASQQCQRAAHNRSSEFAFLKKHLSTLYRSTLDARTSRLVANKAPQEGNGFLDPATILA